MSVEAMLESEYAVLLSHPVVRSVEMMRYSVNRLDGYLRARCRLTNGDYLEVALHVHASKQGVAIDDYRCSVDGFRPKTTAPTLGQHPTFPRPVRFSLPLSCRRRRCS